MGLSFDLAEETGTPAARIKVVGVGGAGGNAIRTMIESQVQDVEFIVANTDIQALSANPAPTRIQLGRGLTKGLGAGANPEVGRKAAQEDLTLIQEILQGADMVFVTAGMGGGTGTGAAPIIAQVARDLGALTVGVVTKPFMFEGKRRAKFADAGLNELANHVDTLITIPNQKLVGLNEPDLTLMDAFRKADDVLVHAVQGISDLIQQTGTVNVDFADVKSVMTNMGMALMGIGYGRGERRAHDAALAAISSPLLDNMSVQGATGILINFTGGPDMKLNEINDAATMIMDEAHEDANIIFGSVINPDMRDAIKVTVIATGFGREPRSSELQVPKQSYVSPPMQMPAARPSAMPSISLQNREPEPRYAQQPQQQPQYAVQQAYQPAPRDPMPAARPSHAHMQHHQPSHAPQQRETFSNYGQRDREHEHFEPASQPAMHQPAMRPSQQMAAHMPNAAVHTRPSMADVPATPVSMPPSRRPPPAPAQAGRASSFNLHSNDAELDIPTFLRNNRGNQGGE